MVPKSRVYLSTTKISNLILYTIAHSSIRLVILQACKIPVGVRVIHRSRSNESIMIVTDVWTVDTEIK